MSDSDVSRPPEGKDGPIGSVTNSGDEGLGALIRSALPRRRPLVLAGLIALVCLELFTFSPFYGDVGTGALPLAALLFVAGVSTALVLLAYKAIKKNPVADVWLQEFWLFALSGGAAVTALTLYSVIDSKMTLGLASAAGSAFLLLFLASAVHARLMGPKVSFAPPVLAGLAWLLLVPFNRAVEAISRSTPWVFDGLTLSVMAAILLFLVLAIYLKATVPITMPFATAWLVALGLMTLVPFHEVFGIFSNMAYGSVDRSLSFGGLVLGIIVICIFIARNFRAETVRKEIEKGDSYHRRGLDEDAVRHYNNALGMEPRLSEVWTRKELALKAMGKDREALECLGEVLKKNPRSEGALNESGIILRRQGKPREAIKFFERALEQNPGYVVAWNNKGTVHRDLRQLKQAIKCYDRALELNPRFEKAWVNKARALSAIGQFGKALAAADEALKLNPDSESDWNEKGLIYQKMGKHAEALAHFDKAIKLNPKFEAAWNNRGNALLKMGKTPEALRAYNRALQINVEYAAAWFNEGSALIDTGDIKGAIGALDEAIRLEPASEVAWNERGVALRKLGRYADADKHFERALRLNPNYVAAWNNRGNTLMDQGRSSEAYHHYNIATLIDPGYDRAWYNKGCALLSIGNAQDAMKAFEKSISATIDALVTQENALKELEGKPAMPSPTAVDGKASEGTGEAIEVKEEDFNSSEKKEDEPKTVEVKEENVKSVDAQ
jgi:tetratricopeptide (TPR) repeat protein